jgi:hypothetical protein
MAMDKDELVAELGKLSEKDRGDVISQAAKNDRQQKMVDAAAALRRFAGHKPTKQDETE